MNLENNICQLECDINYNYFEDIQKFPDLRERAINATCQKKRCSNNCRRCLHSVDNCIACWRERDIKKASWPAKNSYKTDDIEYRDVTEPFVKEEGICMLKCQQGRFQSISEHNSEIHWAERQICETCSTNCKNCSGSSTNCTECYVNADIDNYANWQGSQDYPEMDIQGRDL